MTAPFTRPRLSIVVGGHVDHGKSTLVGRLLADAGALPEGKLEQVRALCEKTGRPFEYAFLLDALKDERAQGITIDTARVFFSTGSREYLLLDAPGHVEFVRNLVTGAARAEAALLVVDASEGLQENSRRHAYLLSLLGVRQLVVVMNKMDLVRYDRAVFDRLSAEFSSFLEGLGLLPSAVIPVAARDGANVVHRSEALGWYRGPTLLEALEGFATEMPPSSGPFRMPVQDVYKFTGDGDDRRIVAGTIESGTVRPGDELLFFPSGKRARVRRLEGMSGESATEAAAGQAAGFTLDEQIYVTRGEVAARADQPRPAVTSRFRAALFWLGKEPLRTDREYLLKLGTARVPMRVEKIHQALDPATLSIRTAATSVARLDVADCTLSLGHAIAFDPADQVTATSRFVIVDDYEIAGGGLVREPLADAQAPARDRVLLRNAKWETSFIPVERRAERYRQRPTLLLLTGPRDTDRKQLAKALEARLFAEGQVVYFLGMANVLYGIDADLGRAELDRAEHMRRLGEVANLMLDAGVILLVTAAELTRSDLDLVRAAVPEGRVVTAWLGEGVTTDLPPDLRLDQAEGAGALVERLRAFLAERDAFRPSAREAAAPPAPAVIWFTGLPASGKSTVADWVAAELTRRGNRVERLDGDSLRELFPETGWDRPARDAHVRRVGHLASRLEAHGVTVIASLVSPHAAARDSVRARCRVFVEVHVSTPLDECERRDPKGLYARARRGEIPSFTGVSDSYEPPTAPEVTVDTSRVTVEDAGWAVLDGLERVRRPK
ncbi:MAG: adenylyl-sulfate kinase [Gemmatimonadales bacterium]|nr:adenylyl-sulfate kinase [Gemmatimonadales bacterium]